ncbi:hypothetical protein [Streptomyces sp. 7N604]|uniref:hypothetical protein n=1 Tax=Streptomyces sp. 7N604 TaxID=3457415 RepID=UPI003FD5C710
MAAGSATEHVYGLGAQPWVLQRVFALLRPPQSLVRAHLLETACCVYELFTYALIVVANTISAFLGFDVRMVVCLCVC